MNNYVLFSPIGTTDPIRNSYDGPMLHIVRHYAPKKVYLYYTKEMETKKEEIKKALKPFSVEIKEIVSKVENPHDFDVAGNMFDEALNIIQKENPKDKILLNISSGTPQMKSALCLEVVSSNLQLKPIQVVTPQDRSNIGVDHGGYLEDNLDNLKENGKYIAPNRCIESNILSFRKAMATRDISALIDHFEYWAALEKYKENEFIFKDELGEILEYATLRQNDNKKYRQNKWHNHFNFTKDVNAKAACDYYCILKNKARTGELSYFILLLKPVAEFIAKEYVGYIVEDEIIKHLDQYYMKKKNRLYTPRHAEVDGRFQTVYNLENYIGMMEGAGKPQEDIDDYKKILAQLEIRRNNLAHGLYREDEIKADYSLNIIKKLIKRTYGNRVKDQSLELYEFINDEIKKLLY